VGKSGPPEKSKQLVGPIIRKKTCGLAFFFSLSFPFPSLSFIFLVILGFELGHHAFYTGALPLEPHSQLFLL
jgi:hypothetical protein